MRYYSEDVVDRIIDDAIQYGIDIDAGGTGERPFVSHYPSVSNNWHTGTPTEDGLYIIIIHPYGSYANEPRYFCYTIDDGILKDCIDDGNICADDFWSQYAIFCHAITESVIFSKLFYTSIIFGGSYLGCGRGSSKVPLCFGSSSCVKYSTESILLWTIPSSSIISGQLVLTI